LLNSFVRDEATGLIQPFQRGRCESGLDLARVVTAKKELTRLKTNTHISLSSTGVASIE
jgi:hypothetical protein